MQKYVKFGLVVVVVLAIVAVAAVLSAAKPSAKVKTSVLAAPFNGTPTGQLPPVDRAQMKITGVPGRAQSVLSFDDGSCESGLGLTSGTWSSLVNFDVPPQCIQAGLSVVGLTAKANSNSANSFLMYQSGVAPGVGRVAIPLAPAMAGNGACPTVQTMQTRAIAPGAAVVAGTANFFAGVYGGAFMGRDTSGVPAVREFLCVGNGATCYTPTYLTSIGFGGNWMIRVLVEDANCVPVELQSFSVQ